MDMMLYDSGPGDDRMILMGCAELLDGFHSYARLHVAPLSVARLSVAPVDSPRLIIIVAR